MSSRTLRKENDSEALPGLSDVERFLQHGLRDLQTDRQVGRKQLLDPFQCGVQHGLAIDGDLEMNRRRGAESLKTLTGSILVVLPLPVPARQSAGGGGTSSGRESMMSPTLIPALSATPFFPTALMTAPLDQRRDIYCMLKGCSPRSTTRPSATRVTRVRSTAPVPPKGHTCSSSSYVNCGESNSAPKTSGREDPIRQGNLSAGRLGKSQGPRPSASKPQVLYHHSAWQVQEFGSSWKNDLSSGRKTSTLGPVHRPNTKKPLKTKQKRLETVFADSPRSRAPAFAEPLRHLAQALGIEEDVAGA